MGRKEVYVIAAAIICLLVLICSCSAAKEEVDPCLSSQYTVIEDDRRSTGVTLPDQRQALDDSSMPEKWYRFTSHAGSHIPSGCQSNMFGRCFTRHQVYMKGALPPDDGVVHGITVCVNKFGFLCDSSCYTIKVKNCGTFPVYRLKPTPIPTAAYCAGEAVKCAAGTVSHTGYTPCGSPDALPKAPQQPTLKLKEQTSGFEFHCVLTGPNNNLTHTVHWLADEKLFLQYDLGNGEASAVVNETKLTYHGKSVLGMRITCAVRAANPKTKVATSFVHSSAPGYYLGLQFVDNAGNEISELTVKKQEANQTKIYVKSTVPVKCNSPKWFLDTSKGFVTNCAIEFRVENPTLNEIMGQLANQSDSSCSPHKKFASEVARKIKFGVCSVVLKSVSWSNYKDQSVTIMAVNDGETEVEPETRYIKFYADSTYQHVWKDYTKYLKVNVVSTRAPGRTPAVCTNRRAGLLTTFDTTLYINNRLGEFILYESIPFNIRVNVYTQQCAINSANICYCGIAAQAGNDIIIVDGCHSFGDIIYGPGASTDKSKVVRTKEVVRGDRTEGFELERAGKDYKIKLPHGAVLKVEPFTSPKYSVTAFLFDLTPSQQDYNDATEAPQVQGLCGTFSRDERDDLRLRNGTLYALRPGDKLTVGSTIPSGFLVEWSVARRSRESMYNGQILKTEEYTGQQHCSCVVNKASRDQEHVMCTYGNPCSNDKVLIDNVQAITAGRRRKRDVLEDRDTLYLQELGGPAAPLQSNDWAAEEEIGFQGN